jgi:hypothetical protein
VRDDRPFGGKNPSAALFYASRDRTREHPGGIWPATPAFCKPTRSMAKVEFIEDQESRRVNSSVSMTLRRDNKVIFAKKTTDF